MAGRDPIKARARQRRYRDQKKAAKFGPDSIGHNLSGRHGNHAHGAANGRWTGGRFVTSHGYVAVRVDASHPHAWGHHPKVKYAYEHILVAEASLGRSLADDEIVHHRNGIKTDNAPLNLEVVTRSQHAMHHSIERGRDELGRFPPADLRVPPENKENDR